MPFQLAVEGQQTPGIKVELRPGTNVVGRAEDADIRLDATLVSRRHAQFVVEDAGTVVVQDLASHNGTFVNGERVGSRTLHSGDRVYVGGFVLTLDAGTPPGDSFSLEGRLQQAPVLPALLKAVDAARLGDAGAFSQREGSLRQVALLARAAEVFARATSSADYQVRLLSLVRDVLRASSVALVVANENDQLDVAQVLSAPGTMPPVSWQVAREALSCSCAFYSRQRPVEADLLEGAGSGVPQALLVAPLLADPQAPPLGALQALRPFTPGGLADHEVDLAVGLCHLLAQRMAHGTTSSETDEVRPLPDPGPRVTPEALRTTLSQALPEELAERLAALVEDGQDTAAPALQAGEHAVAFFEIPGFDAWVSQHGPEAGSPVLALVHGTALAVASAFGGRVDLAVGAGGFLRFWEGGLNQAVETALRAVVDLRARLHPALEDMGVPLQMRSAVDVGPVLAGVVGRGARVTYLLSGAAARVSQQASCMVQEGDVAITGSVKVRLAARAGWRLVALGPHALRGHPDVVDLFRVEGAPAGST